MTDKVNAPFWQHPGVRTWLAMAAGVPLGALASALLYVVFAGLTPLDREFVSGMGIFGLPFFMGAATLCLSTPRQQADAIYRIMAPWGSVLLLYLVLAAIALETVICLVMLALPLMGVASIGGVSAGFVLTRWRGRQARGTTLASVMVLPLLMGPLEPLVLPVKQEIVTISDRIVIAAPVHQVWQTLLHVPNIRRAELESSFSHAIGLPRPRAALMTGEGVGAVRDLYWDDGVHFRERITAWQPAKLLGYDVDVSTAREALSRLDPHVVIGDRYFDVESGRYELHALDDGHTQLVLRTTYRISTRINGYGKFWADRTLHDFHGVVLALLRDRAENAAPTSVATLADGSQR